MSQIRRSTVVPGGYVLYPHGFDKVASSGRSSRMVPAASLELLTSRPLTRSPLLRAGSPICRADAGVAVLWDEGAPPCRNGNDPVRLVP